jgi:Cu-Zn family superoxide dismutase
MRLFAVLGLSVLLCEGAGAAAIATARIIDLDRNVIGRATFQSTGHGVLIEIDVKGLVPGPHAIFLHGAGTCEPGTAFASAGPILSFEPDRPHGYLANGGPRAGDLPTQYAASDGTLHATVMSGSFTLGNGYRSVFDADGASIVIHAKGDDYLSQPEGNAGARIACGTLIRTAPPGPHKKASKHR